MGYTTDFFGKIAITPPLNPQEIEYLQKFNQTRRMERKNGPYFVDGSDFHGQGEDNDIINYNSPPAEQPGLWCQWVSTDDGQFLEWDGGEKFYSSLEWMEYLIEHFLKPDAIAKQKEPDNFSFLQGHILNGTIEAQGEDHDDHWFLVVDNNKVS